MSNNQSELGDLSFYLDHYGVQVIEVSSGSYLRIRRSPFNQHYYFLLFGDGTKTEEELTNDPSYLDVSILDLSRYQDIAEVERIFDPHADFARKMEFRLSLLNAELPLDLINLPQKAVLTPLPKPMDRIFRDSKEITEFEVKLVDGAGYVLSKKVINLDNICLQTWGMKFTYGQMLDRLSGGDGYREEDLSSFLKFLVNFKSRSEGHEVNILRHGDNRGLDSEG